MKNRFIPTVLFALFGIAYCTGCFTVLHAQGPSTPPPPLKDYFPDTWDEYSFPAGQFRIRFPQKPQEAVANQGKFEVHSIEYKGLLNYRVLYVDLGSEPTSVAAGSPVGSLKRRVRSAAYVGMVIC